MNGPDHYREAERLMRVSASMSPDGTGTFISDHERFAAAQVHATLALVAVTAEACGLDGLNVPDWSDAVR